MKSIFSNFFRANLVSTLHSFWWFSLFIFFLTPKNLFGDVYTITVTASGTSHYTLNNAELGFTDEDDPNITVTWSDKLIFDISTIKSIHPLAIVDQLTADDGYDVANRVDFVLNNGDGENTVEWDINGVTPGTYYYICTNHKFMKGTITVVESLSGIDSDGDGVDDNVDVDDDNDGILDIFECGPATSPENLILNGDFETWEDFAVSGVHPPADWDQYSSGLQSVVNPRDRYPANVTSAPSQAQSENIYLRLYNGAGLSQGITTEINKEYTIKFYHAAVFQDDVSNGTPDGRIEVYIDDVLEATTPSIVLADGWQEFTTTFTATSTATKIGFKTPANTSLHQSGIDNISVTLPSENCEDIDTDGDGDPNRIDPDSDQDSCPDLIEAGYVDPDEPTDGMVGRISNGFTYDGKVKNVDYFTLLDQIDDLDSNGVKDFLEKGSVLSIDLDPLSIDTLEYSTVTFTGQGTTDLDLGTIFYSWQISENDGNFWQDVDLYIASNPNHSGIYSGTDSTVLTIDSITADMDKLLYRLYMQTPAFKCDQDIVTNAATLSVSKFDYDGDNIPDEDDLDDDNDGIKDVDEGGETLDTDGDGFPNRIDIDSDGDGCNDVDEAGITTDDNNDGEVGIPIINVNSNGLVTSSGDGLYTYGIPVDLDGNGTSDFLEVGDYASVISSPDDVETPNNNEVIFVAEGQSDCALEYEWEVSTDAGLTWFSINDFENIGEQSEIMIVGGGNPRNFNSGSNYSFLELYANEDIEANKYEVVLTTTMGVKHSQIINTNISKGKYILFGDHPNYWVQFFENTSVHILYDDKYGQYYTWQDLSRLMGEFIIEIRTVDDGIVVDRFGREVLDGAPPWTVDQGFFKRKPNQYADSSFTQTDWDICADCLKKVPNSANDTPYDWGNVILPDTSIYSGVFNDTLKINATRTYMDRYQYRAKIRSLCYACDNGSFTSPAELVVFLDSDGDGVGDAVDLDKDNDGILDSKEGSPTDDFDEDGIPNNLDLDSDGDGCSDVLEALFPDPDGDGVFGVGKPAVDPDGRIVAHDYSDPADNDSNTIYDFLQFSKDVRIFSNPTPAFIDEEEDTIFVASATQYSSFTDWRPGYPRTNSNYNYALAYAGYANNYVGAHLGWIDINSSNRVYVVEFDTIIDEVFPANIEKLLDFRGHSYYVSRYAGSFRSKFFDDALQTAFDAGGYMHVVDDAYESEKIREAIYDLGYTNWYWVNFFQDTNSELYAEPDSGWFSGFIPNSAAHQWQVSMDGGNNWQDLSDGANYSGVNKDTLRIISAPAGFDQYEYRLKAYSDSYACGSGLVYSNSAVLTVSSDPDNDGVKNSIDLDDDNDGILDDVEGDIDTDGDGIPNRLDLDSDGDGCLDAQEAGFTGFDAEGRLCNDTNCADPTNGTVNGHSYDDPLDQDNTTIYDFLEIGQVPSITLNLDAISIAAVDASKTLVVSGTAPDFSVEPTYYNWYGSNPDESGNEDWMDMRLGDGGWNDNRNNRNYRWIVEFNTLDPVIPDDEINTYDLLTTYNGHAYYISKSVARPHWANIFARNTGGYLTFINDAAENEILRSSASTYVHGVDNTSSNTRVWIGIYQNNSSPKFVEKAGGWESYPMPSTVNYQWQISSDSVNWSDITAANNLFLLNDTTISLSNYNTDQLTVSPTINSLNGYKFRVKIFNPAFVCASEVISEETMLIIRSDFDGDGVEDDADVDDDNDGIWDIHEGNGAVDTDGDGDPDSKDLDSDNDGCSDVDEGYGKGYDPNIDRIFGDVNPVINPNGSVVGSDQNMSGIVGDDGIKDFLQYDQEILDMTCPDDPNITVVGGQELIAITTATGMGDTYVDYHWQISKDSGTTWTSASDEDKSDLIISGIGYGQTNTADDGSPKFIEFYALDDVNLSDYAIFSHRETSSENYGAYDIGSVSVNKGDYILIYYIKNTGDDVTFFENDIDLLYDHTESYSTLRNDMQDGIDKFTLRKKNSSGVYEIVDRIGSDSSVPNYHHGWLYRKSNSFPNKNFNENEWITCTDCLNSAVNSSSTTPFPLKSYKGVKVNYDQSKGDSLIINDVPEILTGYQFRSIASTPSFACGENDTSCVISITVLPDFDRDSIPDEVDLDKDNDGILDADEGDADNDGDGIPNWFDLDSDNDGCFDVKEAGFEDPDNDGILGNSPVEVDDDGKVTGFAAFTTPVDLDNNTVYDYLEAGSDVVITSFLNFFLSEGSDTATFFVEYTAIGTVDLQWQTSSDNVIWSDLSDDATYTGSNTNTLKVKDIDDLISTRKFRLVLTTPAFACHDTTISVISTIDFDEDVDNDGIPNEDDLDDDNDGILDTDEGGEDEDFDNDGIRNRFDLDSDGDNCLDVVEAGFNDYVLTDLEDGLLGDLPITVNSDGLVTSGLIGDGYSDPQDRDSDGNKDFKQYGESIVNAVLDNTNLELLSSESGSFTITASVTGGHLITYQWQESPDGGVTWFNVPDVPPYSGGSTNVLTLSSPDESLDGYKYRVILSLPSYVCAEIPINLNTEIKVFNDNDKDGVRDTKDNDDDNDGILDSFEGDEDLDQDGIPNWFDLDSDGDGCNDVIEAGFLDQNADGRLGPEDTLHVDTLNSNGQSTIDSNNGQVLNHGGNSTPNDLDNNGVYDFLEEGSPITNITCPDSVIVAEGGAATFLANASVNAGEVRYQWEISKDNGNSWNDIVEPALAIVGLGNAYRETESEGSPKFIELIATNDIDDLSRYRLYNYLNGSTGYSNNFNFSGSLKKGQMILLYRNDASHFSDYFGIQLSDYDMAINGSNLLDNLRGGDDVVELVYADNDGNPNWNYSSTDVVDAVGTRGQGGIDTPWNYSLGWIKRKNGRSINKTFKLSDWTLCKGCFGASYTHAEATTPYDINNRLINLGGMGSNSNTLELTNISYDEYNGALVRAKVSNPGFVCQVDTVSCEARIQVVPTDTDGDGVPDKDDLDDDNDGILDVTEGGELLDTDGDEIPNRIDYDSDNDGCLDVKEAGFEDSDLNGQVGNGIPSVDPQGRILGHLYTIPLDNDNNLTADFLQYSQNVIIDQQPIDLIRQGGDDAEFFVTVTGETVLQYLWQVSDDSVNWSDLFVGGYYAEVDSDTLKILNTDENLDGKYYRVKIITPSLICSDPVFSAGAKLTAKEDSDGDGIINEDDFDSDNDGILNEYEGVEINLDTDGDGIPDFLDLDSDNDGCFDVVEAGHSDPDNDGIPGIGSPEIEPFIGTVKNHNYGLPDNKYDADGTGIGKPVGEGYDFREPGGPVTSVSHPLTVETSEGKIALFNADGNGISPVAFQWQVSSDNGTTWLNVPSSPPYTGSDSTTLVISPVSTSLNSNFYRAVVSTPGFACGADMITEQAKLLALPDNDRDGIQDLIDLDDDNDGILDVHEFVDDFDGDGVFNRYDLDSDNDGCNDVIEAGLNDGDGDGILGDSVDIGDGTKVPALVDEFGRVTSGGTSHYNGTEPDDLDDNDVYDFLEVGSQVEIDNQPEVSYTVSEFDDLNIIVEASASGNISYQWQVSDACDGTWEDIPESPSLIITGVFSNRAGFYELVELYAVKDIDNLSDYGLSVSSGDAASGVSFENKSLQAGQYYMLYANGDAGWTIFFSDEQTASYKTQQLNVVGNLYDQSYNIKLWKGSQHIDSYGNSSESSSGKPWDLNQGWAYRKNGRGASTTFNIDDWNIRIDEFKDIGGNATNGNDVAQNSYPLFKFSSPQQYIGTRNDTLTISKVPLSFDNLYYRVIVETPAFKCDTIVVSSCSFIDVEPMTDTDNDGVPDYVDLDSDNDGILDETEGCLIDTDGDGIVNCLDLDSDGDDCPDVIEAGFTDEDGDRLLGPDPAFVDVNGVVTSASDGYSTPDDNDNNGVPDYLEEGAQPTVITDPSTVDVEVMNDTTFIGTGTAPGIITQRWQQSDDNAATFRTLENTPDLFITGVMEGARSGARPHVIEFKALKEIQDVRSYKIHVFKDDNNGDGVTDFRDNPVTISFNNDPILIPKDSFFYAVDYSSLAEQHLAGSGDSSDFDLNKERFHSIGLANQMNGMYSFGLSKFDSATSEYKLVDYVESSGSENYNLGWKYRKDTSQIYSDYYKAEDWTTKPDVLNGKLTNVLAGTDRFPIKSYNKPVIISGVSSDTLRIENIPFSMDGYKYNLEMITLGFACDVNVFTDVSELKVFIPDSDGDKKADNVDLDSDNDGILNSDEGDEDIDGDGIPNYLDPDSDGDGCPDVIEAGFTDPDDDYYLGVSPVTTDDNGLVTGQGGYTIPPAEDLDANGVPDYKEKGSDITLTRSPNNLVLVEENVKFFVEASSLSQIFYQWQYLQDTTTTNWEDILDGGDFSDVSTDTLRINNISAYSDYWFRVVMTAPGYACADTVFSDYAKILNTDDWDNDNILDVFDIDDDNDGIKDVDEGEGDNRDTDNDGIPDYLDNDSDNDGCFDVIEAGYVDEDNDGYLGMSPVTVTGLGTVIYDPPGYTGEDDLDDNGVSDLLEVGSQAVADIAPVNDTVEAGQNASFNATFIADGTIVYTWQISSDYGVTWSDVIDTVVVGSDSTFFSGLNTTILNIENVTYEMHDYQVRLVASTPSFKCGLDLPSVPASIKIAGDNDQDGIIDAIDLDDDNDGILDTDEGGGDIDGDGIPNWFDLDSDGDDCSDTEEAGFEDPDRDRILCLSPVRVDGLGKVICIDDSSCDADPINNMDWNPQQDAFLSNDGNPDPDMLKEYYVITDRNDWYEYGSVFRTGGANSGRIDLNNDFYLSSELYFDGNDNGKAGIGFSLARNNNQWNGVWSWNSLQMAFNNALSIEFGTSVYPGGTWDPINDHVSLHINGNNLSGTDVLGVTQNKPLTSYTEHFKFPIQTVELPNIEDGNWKKFEFSWNATDKTVNVDFEGVRVVTYTVDLINDVMDGENLVYFGFTSDTYNSYTEHRATFETICEGSNGGESFFKGYKTPNDLNEDGIPDYKQVGDIPTFSDTYEDDEVVIIEEGRDTTFTATVNYSGVGDIVWQMCNTDDCSSCTTIEESPGLMLTGVFRGDIGPGLEPSSIEVYALEDIADLSVYGIEITRNGNESDGKDYSLASVSLDSGKFYTISSSDFYQNTWFSSAPNQESPLSSFTGDEAIVLYKNDEIIDLYGVPGVDGSGQPWEYTLGWAYRKDGRIYSSRFNVNDWTTCRSCTSGFIFNEQMDNPFPYRSFAGAPTFTDVNSDVLKLRNATASLDGTRIRRAVLDPAYFCTPESGGDCIRVGIFLDNDKDGIVDEIDLDDDNDGILDSIETDLDIDNDGIPNRFDLDSDNDGCFDVLEAGFTDGDDDGILGNSPETVDDMGLVTSGVDGYTEPNDNDNSGGYDFLEFGSVAVLVRSPDSIQNTAGADAFFVAKGTAQGGSMNYYPFNKDNWVERGNVYSTGDYYRLTYQGGGNHKSQVWNRKRIRIDRDFIISSELYFGNNFDGGHGIAFVLQNEPIGVLAGGANAGSLGWDDLDIDNALAIEFDTYGEDEVRIVSRKNGTSVTIALTKLSYDLEDNKKRLINVSWEEDTKIITVSIDGTDVITSTIDVETAIFASEMTYFGFTGSTGHNYAETNQQRVYNIAVTGILEGDESGNVIFEWQYSADSAATWTDITEDDSLTFSGINNDTLLIPDVSESFDGYVFRAKVRNPAFACDPGVFSQFGMITILPDNDKDGIPDDDDVDDDNDGILDIREDTTDLDGDGIPNHFDLDSDGDGCFDVIEAGFDDNDFYYDPYEARNETVTWYQWLNNQPDNSGNNEHFGILAGSGYNDVNGNLNRRYLMEISEPHSATTEGWDDLYTYVGEYNNHSYYKSKSDNHNWNESRALAEAFPGGYLAVISTQDEYNYIKSQDGSQMFIGLYQDTGSSNYSADLSEPSGEWVWVPSVSRKRIDDPDGILGNSPVTVNFEGRVVKSNDNTTSKAYFTPKDGDNNGSDDYREFGSAAVITSQPLESRVEENDTIILGSVVDVIGTALFQWEESRDSGYTWIPLPEFFPPYDGVKSDTLKILGAPLGMNGYQYRMIVSTPSYACGSNDTTRIASIGVSNDFDEDGIPNSIDIDDDNDGIVDTLEVIEEENDDDYDNDGIPNHFDLDSDDDGCSDVLEAGFSDPDGDGILCSSPVTVNAVGQVIGCTGSTCSSLDVNEYDMVTDAQFIVSDSSYKLTNASMDQKGLVWSKSTVDLSYDFNLKTQMRFGDDNDGGNGIAFILQNISSAVQSSGTSDLGYTGLTPSVAVEFDTYFNDATYDIVDDHVGLVYNGAAQSSNERISNLGDIEDGLYHDVEFIWDSGSKNLSVTFDGSEVINMTKDFVADIFGSDPNVFFGFSSTTTNTYNEHSVRIVEICSGAVPTYSPLDGYTTPIDADGSGTVDFKEVDDYTMSFDIQPSNIEIPDKSDAYIFTKVNSSDSLSYQWQRSDDGIQWYNISDDTIYLDRGEGIFDSLIFIGTNSDTLFIYNMDSIVDSTFYRVLVDIPSSPCAVETPSSVSLLQIVNDIDLDNDGISNDEEGYGDDDGDGIPNYLDLDSDNDGIPDVIEGGDGDLDTNGDGVIDILDVGFTDVDGDGMADDSENTPQPDTDGDGNPDYLDIDSDNDGIFDVDEGGDGDLDTNDDGVIDANDVGYTDNDGDGMDDDSENTPQPDTDGDGNPDYLDIDSDNDGIFDVDEGGDGDLDTNDDGVIDANDVGYTDNDGDGMDDDSENTTQPDSDGDGNPNHLDIDSDNDGIFDVDEGGDGDLDTNDDGVIDSNDTGYTDNDGDGMDDDSESTPVTETDGDNLPDYLDIDSDNDGIFDVDEGGDGDLDTNNDGVIDSNDTGYTDNDGDGMDDDSELTPVEDFDGDGDPDYQDIDSDNDGIFDVDEGGDGDLDTNNDGVIDANDIGYTDNDGDGMDDDSELTPVEDFDGDGSPDYLDIDSDNDGIPDVIEAGDGDLDTNNDGVIDSNDTGFTDNDGDGMDDDSELTPVEDFDGDGLSNYLDIDSDNDGIFDVDEGGDGDLDTNDDGVIDSNDTGFTDNDGDGMDDDSESTPVTETDGDNLPDYLDVDSDNDGIFDVDEGGDGDLDTNNDGVIDSNDNGFTDNDGDGMDDDSELTPVEDFDGDGSPDYQDIDSDNDGIFDVDEGGDGDLDTNNDGVIDSNDTGYTDNDGDGMDDDSENTSQPDSDGDGNLDYLDIDSDNDGIFDVDEGGDGVLDTNGDGVIDGNDSGFTDDDGDGMDDDSELTTVVDSDGDGLSNYLDIDSDNDGIFDVDEGGDGDLDTNNDGVIDSNDNGYTDNDGDGMDDDAELTLVTETDNDNYPDYIDIDADNDGIFDVDEGGDGNLDTNDDGVIDGNDIRFSDNDGNGMDDDSELSPVLDTDGDNVLDYQDLDSDNDGIFDVIEGGDGMDLDSDNDGNSDYSDLDTNEDGMIDSNDDGYEDSDGDGMDDRSELTRNLNSDADETQNDQIPNYIDLDSDDDGCFDVAEAGYIDVDENGILGEGAPTVNSYGMVISDDEDGYTHPLDSDENGILDCYDPTEVTIVINSQPQYAGEVFQGEDVTYFVDVSSNGNVLPDYQWQMGIVSADESDTTWNDITENSQFVGVNTSSLTIKTVDYINFDNTQYRVIITTRGYVCASTVSDPVNLNVSIRELHIPEGFSPNSDGVNDSWFITGIDFYPNNKVQIYNRWEIKIWEKEGYENEISEKYFDGISNYGMSNGKLLPETVYFYLVDLGTTDIDGLPVPEANRYRKGFVYIRRDIE